MNSIKGVLLINLGTPLSPSTSDVRTYLKEFLLDERVIDINPISRNLLVRGIIAPFRAPKSAAIYKKVWTEKGSPLMVITQNVQALLVQKLGAEYVVDMAMRYQEPTIEAALERLYKANISELTVIPLFPQYASASTGSVIEKVMALMSKWQYHPNLKIINNFYNHPLYIKAVCEKAKPFLDKDFDHVLFSFHGLPVRQLFKSNPNGHCKDDGKCCLSLTNNNIHCYSAQCFETARLLAETLNITKDMYTVCFQSRLGKEKWTTPFAPDVLKELAGQGKKKILAFSPAFVSDCLETLYEIVHEFDEDFKAAGGEKVQLVPCVNEHPIWIEALENMVKS